MRTAIGFILRLMIATAISLLVLWLYTTPFDRLPLSLPAIMIAFRILNFPVALSSELLYPIRGVELLFGDGGTWCDFCDLGEMARRQLRIAIPTYLFLLYIPAVLRSIARRNARLFQRVLIGLLVYTLFTTSFILVMENAGRDHLRMAAIVFLVAAAAATVAWSKLDPRWKLGAIAAILLLGAWAVRFIMTVIAPEMEDVHLSFVSYLILLIAGAGGPLSLTWAIQNTIERWRRRRDGSITSVF